MFDKSIIKGLGSFGIINYELKDCVSTYITKLFEIKDLVSILMVKVKKGGFVPLHEHENLTVMIPIKGIGIAFGENNKSISTKGELHIAYPKEKHGFENISEDLYFLSICIGGRIISNNKKNPEEDFKLS